MVAAVQDVIIQGPQPGGRAVVDQMNCLMVFRALAVAVIEAEMALQELVEVAAVPVVLALMANRTKVGAAALG